MSFSPPTSSTPSFDPATQLHSESCEPPHATLPVQTYSDDLLALYLQKDETRALKNEQGVVIQHRAWRLGTVFRSEEDYEVATPTKSLHGPCASPTVHGSASNLPPSSPPAFHMPLLSSPLAYPPISSPTVESPRKRRKIERIRSPLQDVPLNRVTKTVGGFLVDGDSEDETDFIGAKATRIDRYEAGSGKGVVTTSLTQCSVHNSWKTCEQSQKPTETNLIFDDELHILPTPNLSSAGRKSVSVKTCSGNRFDISAKARTVPMPYEQLIAARSKTAPGRARKSYYGIDIHQLMDDAAKESEAATNISREAPQPTVEQTTPLPAANKNGRSVMWTEKYRARKFTDLIGDERTHRSVLRWLKGWDPVVFPGSSRPKSKTNSKGQGDRSEDRAHRKILLLTGPPGLGKTTLAHVCARQAGYEVQEINASDERNRDIVKGRIRDMLGTENVKLVDSKASGRKAARPLCVIVDEADGVVSGSGSGGEGGFVKALIDLIHLDQKSSNAPGNGGSQTVPKKKRKGDYFRMLRPLILICNDVYHPSLRLLRQGSIAEIVHVRNPALNMVISRMQSIFERESVPCDSEGVRRLCEAAWGVNTRKENGQGKGGSEGDIRAMMVVAEWVAGKIRAVSSSTSAYSSSARLTRGWVEEHVLGELSHGGGAARSLGRGGTKEIVDRVFLEGAGFPKTAVAEQPQFPVNNVSTVGGVSEASKKRALDRLREMVDTSGEWDRVISDCFTAYPTQPFQDDTLLTKPTIAAAHLQFHDRLSTLVHHHQEWELAPYLSQSVLAFHHLFASPATAHASWSTSGASSSKWGIGKHNGDAAEEEQQSPFTGPRADFEAKEALAANTAHLQSLQTSLSLPLRRQFRCLGELATDLVPYVLRMLSPDVKPVVVGEANNSSASVRKASEKEMVGIAANAMLATGVSFEKTRVEAESNTMYGGGAGAGGGWVYRMEPPLDEVGTYSTKSKITGEGDGKVRFAVRQVLDAECKREMVRRADEARRARWAAGGTGDILGLDETALEKSGKHKDKDAIEQLGSKAKKSGIKRDFFGRVISDAGRGPASGGSSSVIDAAAQRKRSKIGKGEDEGRVWVSFHEGYSNAVRKPITMEELLRGL